MADTRFQPGRHPIEILRDLAVGHLNSVASNGRRGQFLAGYRLRDQVGAAVGCRLPPDCSPDNMVQAQIELERLTREWAKAPHVGFEGRACQFRGCSAPAVCRVGILGPSGGQVVCFACADHKATPGALVLQEPEVVRCGACGRQFRIEHLAAGAHWIFRFCPICGERALA